jgi:membrane protein
VTGKVKRYVDLGRGLVSQTFKEWSDDKAPRLGAALSYYTVFSLAPVLILVISIAGLVFGKDAAEGRLVGELRGLLGTDSAEVVQTMLAKASKPAHGVVSAIIGFFTLLLGATGVLIELQDALNTVWKVKPKPGGGVREILRERLLSFGLILAFGFLLLVSLVLSAVLSGLGGAFSRFIPGWVIFGYLLNYVVALAVTSALIASIYKILPDVKMAWRDVWVGAVVTSLLFQLGKFLIGLYVGKASVGSPFGAAGSLAVLLVWVYYSSQIILFGAEFTRVSAIRRGAHIVATSHADPAPDPGALTRETDTPDTDPRPPTERPAARSTPRSALSPGR